MTFWDHLVQLPTQAGTPRGGCPVRFWISPRMNTPQPDYATQSSVWPPSNKKSLHVFRFSFLFGISPCCFLFCQCTKSQKSLLPSSSFLPFSYTQLYTSCEPSFLQVEESHLSQHLLMWWIIKSIKPVPCWSHSVSSLLLWNPQNPDETLRVLIRVEGSSPSACVFVNPAWEAVGHLCLMTHCCCTVYCPPWPQGPFLQSCFPSGLATLWCWCLGLGVTLAVRWWYIELSFCLQAL